MDLTVKSCIIKVQANTIIGKPRKWAAGGSHHIVCIVKQIKISNIFIAFMLYKRSQHSQFLQHSDQKSIGKLMSASVCYIWKLSKKDLQFNHLVRYLLLSVQICYSNKKILSIIGILSCRYNSIYLCQCTWDWSTVLAKWYILLHDYCGEPKSISSNSFCS